MGCGASTAGSAVARAEHKVLDAVTTGVEQQAHELGATAAAEAAAVVRVAKEAAAAQAEQGRAAVAKLLGAAEHTLGSVTQEATFTRDAALTCKVFGSEGENHFPELSDGDFGMQSLQAKPDFAVCLSGGGMRATTCSLGVVRALYEQGILSQARYLSSTSGASWFNSCLSFAQLESLGEFLGSSVPPSELTPAVLGQVGEKGRSYMASIADSKAMQHFLKNVIVNAVGLDWWKNESGAWTEAMSTVFFEPFDLGDLKTSTVTALGTRGQVDQRIQATAASIGLERVYEYHDLEQLPFPILTQNVLQPKDSRVFFPFEWTPLYAGMPAPLTDEQGRKYGGGWVEPIGQNSLVTQAPEGPIGPNGADIALRSIGPASLAEAAGISSAYIPYSLALGKTVAGEAANLLLGGSRQQYWSPQDYGAQYASMSDGGGTDVSGIMPLLRRKVRRVLCWLSTHVDPVDPNAFAIGCDVAPLFGKYPGNSGDKPAAELQNQLQQVFPPEAWDALYKDAHSRFTSGGPVWHRAKLAVSSNGFQGVPGGWEVDVMFVWNCSCLNFHEQLPAETLALMAGDKDKFKDKLRDAAALQPFLDTGLAAFPLISTQCMNYSPELIVALSNLSAWAINSLSVEIKKLLAS